ncbi:hypothetical protein [Streptomyces sp. NBC_00568]|uniref:hypothetical protein n=1 Tax=Streptomyces sp. NBC_00568 TaxID=2975779 RepID=UPI0022560967|nr:hypothetical protein [Streptomyces sp. NBC_00568]MCX4993656.1 hypothetical protein [Streptomyces sp. NBC_00568]
MQSDKRTASIRALAGLLCEVPARDDFLFWHIINTRGYLRSAQNVMIVEPYSDGSTMRRLAHGIDHLTRTDGDDVVRDDLCVLLSELFHSADVALASFLNRYMRGRGHVKWRSADVWLRDLDVVLDSMAEREDIRELRRGWLVSDDLPVQPGIELRVASPVG